MGLIYNGTLHVLVEPIQSYLLKHAQSKNELQAQEQCLKRPPQTQYDNIQLS